MKKHCNANKKCFKTEINATRKSSIRMNVNLRKNGNGLIKNSEFLEK